MFNEAPKFELYHLQTDSDRQHSSQFRLAHLWSQCGPLICTLNSIVSGIDQNSDQLASQKSIDVPHTLEALQKLEPYLRPELLAQSLEFLAFDVQV